MLPLRSRSVFGLLVLLLLGACDVGAAPASLAKDGAALKHLKSPEERDLLALQSKRQRAWYAAAHAHALQSPDDPGGFETLLFAETLRQLTAELQRRLELARQGKEVLPLEMDGLTARELFERFAPQELLTYDETLSQVAWRQEESDVSCMQDALAALKAADSVNVRYDDALAMIIDGLYALSGCRESDEIITGIKGEVQRLTLMGIPLFFLSPVWYEKSVSQEFFLYGRVNYTYFIQVQSELMRDASEVFTPLMFAGHDVAHARVMIASDRMQTAQWSSDGGLVRGTDAAQPPTIRAPRKNVSGVRIRYSMSNARWMAVLSSGYRHSPGCGCRAIDKPYGLRESARAS